MSRRGPLLSKQERAAINSANRRKGHLNPYRQHPWRDAHSRLVWHWDTNAIPHHEPWRDFKVFADYMDAAFGPRWTRNIWVVPRPPCVGYFPGHVMVELRRPRGWGQPPAEFQQCFCPHALVLSCWCPFAAYVKWERDGEEMPPA